MAPAPQKQAKGDESRLQVFSLVQLLVIASVSAAVTLTLSALAPSMRSGPAEATSGTLRHSPKGTSLGDVDEIPAISQLLGRPFRLGSGPKCNPGARKQNHNYLHELQNRGQIGELLQSMNLTGDGVEIGVSRGLYSEQILTTWKAGRKYYLVDPWTHQEDYVDWANTPQEEQDKTHAEAMERLKPFGDRVVVKRKFSYDAVKEFEDCSLDFIYIDAVHDYDGALVDMVDWWPKLAYGGLYAGHDYGDFTMGGETVESRTIFGVKSAADHFAVLANRQLWQTHEPEFGGHFFGGCIMAC